MPSRRRLLQILCFGAAAVALASTRPVAAPRVLNVVQWSDVHFGNEEYRPQAWDEAWRQGTAMHPDMIVMSGDEVDNKCTPPEFDQREDDFLSVLSSGLKKVGIPAVMALGNNDGNTNYQTAPEVLADTMSHYRKYFGAGFYLDDLGNGVFPHDVGGLRWISLNSVIFSPKDHYAGQATQATETLDWLTRKVQATPAGQPLVLVMHVPPVKDLLDQQEAWELPSLRRFASILDDHRGPIYLFCGHFHRNEVHALKLPSGRVVPVLLAGSLSGKFGAFPNWRFYRWSVNNDIQYTVRYPQHQDWETHYDLPHPETAAAYEAFIAHLNSSAPFYQQYEQDFYGHNPLSVFSALPPLQADAESEIVEQP